MKQKSRRRKTGAARETKPLEYPECGGINGIAKCADTSSRIGISGRTREIVPGAALK